MNYEELIEEARKAVHAVIPGSGPYDSWPPATGQGVDFLGDIARAAFAVFEKAQAPTDEERDASCGSYSDQEGVSLVLLQLREAYYPQGLEALSCDSIAFAITAAGFRRPAQTEPTGDERETLPVASRDVWGWDTCVVCGSKEVSDRGMVIMGASKGAPYVARIGWCDQSQECQEDLRLTSCLLTEPDVKVIDALRRPAQTEPTGAQDKGYHVELGDQRFTQAQWEAVQRYCEGHPAQTEPEYEYSWGGVDDEGDDWIMDEGFATVEGAERYADSRMGNWVRTDSGKLIRRVKAGDWEPVPGMID